MKIKTKKKVFFSLFILSFVSITLFVSPLSLFSDISITSGDVIKNFKFESFKGNAISPDGVTVNYGDKLKFESGATWTTTQDDVNLIQTLQEGDKVYLYYQVAFSNKINIFTNVRLDQASSKGLDPITEQFSVGKYQHLQLFGNVFFDWESDLQWIHSDFGSVRDHNYQNNVFSGDLKMSFDIDPSPLPDTLTDDEGNPITKEFDYITVNYIYVDSNKAGKLSTDMPIIEGLTPREYDTGTTNSESGGDAEGSMSGWEGKWNPSIQLSNPFISEVFDAGIIPQTPKSSMNPTQKDGKPIFNPKTTEQSMTDCEFYYSVGTISPLVYKYSSTLSYINQEVWTQDVYDPFPLVKVHCIRDTNLATSYTRDVALHVVNRFIQTEVKVVFSVWTSYQLSVIGEETPVLEDPTQYFDDLLWTTIIDGFGGGSQYTASPTFAWIMDIIILVIIIGVIALVIYLFIQFGLPYLYFKKGLKGK